MSSVYESDIDVSLSDNITETEMMVKNVTLNFVINAISQYYPPLIVFLGTFGNLLSLAVFRCTKLRQLSTSCYLTALSLSDTGCLLSLLATWLDMMGVNVYNRPVCCQFLTYFLYVCGFMSPWFVVAFTVERFVATCYPLRRAAICTVSRAQAVVVTLTVIAAISYLYILFMADIEESSSKCGLKPDHLDTMNVLNFLDTIVTLIIPVILITSLNVLIARAVWQFEKIRRNMTTVSTPLPSSEDDGHHDGSKDDSDRNTLKVEAIDKRRRKMRKKKKKRSIPSNVSVDAKSTTDVHRKNLLPFLPLKHQNVRGCYQMKITKMLLIISTVFVGLNSPSYIVRLWVYFDDIRSDSDNVVLYNVQQWSQLLFNLNFSINFLLYCVSGQNFRRSLKSLIYRILGKVTHDDGRRLSRKSTATVVTNSIPVTCNLNVLTPNNVMSGDCPARSLCQTGDKVVVDSV